MAMIPKSATRDIMIRFSEPAAGWLKSGKGFFWGMFCRFFHLSHSRNEPLGIRPAASEFTRPHAPQALHLKLPDAQGLPAAPATMRPHSAMPDHLARNSGSAQGNEAARKHLTLLPPRETTRPAPDQTPGPYL